MVRLYEIEVLVATLERADRYARRLGLHLASGQIENALDKARLERIYEEENRKYESEKRESETKENHNEQ